MSPFVPNLVDAAALADELAQLRVVNPDRLSDLLAEFPGGGAVALAEFLVRRGAITAFQAERTLAGEGKMLALGPYRLTGTHRVGAFGPVFRAEPAAGSQGSIAPPAPTSGTDRAVAVRVFPLRSLWRAKQAQQLARSLCALPPHPSVAPLVGAGSANGLHYLAWPLVAGPTVADQVAASGSLRLHQVAGFLAQLLDALAACHVRNVVHGVLTPQTVALPPGGPARLLDLGVGTILADDLAGGEALLDTLSTAATAAEVLDFAAPELIADPVHPTPAADQYALAAVAYFALTGRPPFPGRTLSDRLLARESGEPAPADRVNPAIPPALAATLARMLRPDPADRFASLEDARLQLAGGSEASPQAAAPTQQVAESFGAAGRSRSGSRDGSASWDSSGTSRPPERDDSEASVTFDLPANPAPPPVQPVDTPQSALFETQSSSAISFGPQDPAEPPDTRSPTPPPVPKSPTSPARSEVPTMAKMRSHNPVESPIPPPPQPPAKPADPRSSMPTPVHWHTGGQPGEPAPAGSNDPPPTPSALWRRLRRNLLFWKAPTDVVQVSVFGPVAPTPGATARVCVVLHPPEAADSVRTLVRAFEREVELLGTGALIREAARGTELAVHLSVTNAGVNQSLVTFTWRGQPYRANFDLLVPWESPGGPAPGLVSIGHKNVRIGKVEFHLRILPRKG
jgi:serine/threonine-protein kinase